MAALSIHTFAPENFTPITHEELSWGTMHGRVLFYHSSHIGIPCYLHWDDRDEKIVVQSNYTYYTALRSAQKTTRDIFKAMNIPISQVTFYLPADKCMENFIDTPVSDLTHQYSLRIISENEQPTEPVPLGGSLAMGRSFAATLPLSLLPPALPRADFPPRPARTMAYVQY
jgi:hypothetical protein